MRSIRYHSPARYCGLPVAIVMDDDRPGQLVAVAAAGTQQEIALAAIFERPNGRLQVEQDRRKARGLDEAAHIAVERCEYYDRTHGQ